MKKNIFTIAMCLIVFLCFSGFSDSAHFGSDEIDHSKINTYKEIAKEAYLPTFSITINGTVMDNQKSQYPFLVYQNTTYMPLTYGLNRFMGVNLYIYETREKRPDNLYRVYVGRKEIEDKIYTPLLNKNVNPKKVKVEQLKMPLQLNNIGYENDDFRVGIAPSPFVYNKIIYFPLTPQNMQDEFGWEYSWDTKKGLAIDTHDPARPILFNPRGIDQMMPVNYMENNPYDYACNGTVYAGIENKGISNYENDTVIIKEKGKALRTIKLKGFCGVWYSNGIFDIEKELVKKGEIYPRIENNAFTFMGAELKSEDPLSIRKENLYLITIDLLSDQISYKKLEN